MAGFVQIIQYKTSKFDEMQKAHRQVPRGDEGKRTTSGHDVPDRDNAGST